MALARNSRFLGEFSIAKGSRLAEACAADPEHPLQVDLELDDQLGWPRLHGRIEGKVMLACQRCGQGYGYDVGLAPDLRLVGSDEDERAVLGEFDPVRIEDDRLDLAAVIEDEVLLALPMLPRCASCERALSEADAAGGQETEAAKSEDRRENPFAALKQQFKSNRK